MLVFIPLTAP